MYHFKEINEGIVNDFNEKHPKGHIFQTSYWADVKKEWKVKFLGGFSESEELVLTCTILIRKIPYLNSYMGYVPRGFTCDYSDKTLIQEFTEYLKTYSKKSKIAFVTVDPDIHLNENEEPVEFGHKVQELFNKLGYVSKSTKNFENIQPNFVFRLDIDMPGDMEERKKAVFNRFTSKTRYNIKVAQDRGLTVEAYDSSDITDELIAKFHEIMVITGKRDHFITRQAQYFKDMINKISPYCRLYMVKYNYEIDYKRIKEKLDSQLKNRERYLKKKEDAEAQLTSETDEAKIEKLRKKISDAEKGLGDAERQISSFEERIKEIEEYKDKKDLYVSGAIYIYYGGKGWYFYGASHNILRDTMPNFLMQWRMIEDSIDLGCAMYDFRGVSGDLNPENHLYGLYKFKKGFDGKFVEFIGEFDLIISGFVYKMFRAVLPRFKKIRTRLLKK